MDDKTALDILKSAILLEKRGKAFYEKVAEQTPSEAAKRFFDMMAVEEKNHVQILTEQFKHYQETNTFKSTDYENEYSSNLPSAVLNDEIKQQISAADFEAAAISAAMAMEKNAIALYSQRAKAADDPGERDLYRWLAGWEKTHLDFLAKMDRELTENIWHDNSFWPF